MAARKNPKKSRIVKNLAKKSIDEPEIKRDSPSEITISGEEEDKTTDSGETKSLEADNNIPGNEEVIPGEISAEELEERDIDEEETEATETGDCKCQEEDGDYYCYKFRNGRWIQWSLVPYPTKEICEAACCGS